MKPIEKILVPIDYSVHSQEAIRAAAELSTRYDAFMVKARRALDLLVAAQPACRHR